MRRRLGAAVLLGALALLAAGCGSSKSKQSASGGPSGATVIPASVPAFIALDTDLSSDQIKQADALSKKFPARAKALADIQAQMTKAGIDFKADVKPALGPEVDFAWLDFADNGTNAVAVTQPKDEAKFKALVAKGNKSDPTSKLYTEKVGDWTAIADSQAKLDRLKSAQNGAKLADEQRFKDAMGDLPDDALVKAYLNGQAARQALRAGLPPSVLSSGALAGTPLQDLDWISAAATADSNGFRIAARSKTGQGGKTYTSDLVNALPAGAWADVSFYDLASTLRRTLGSLRAIPGFQAKRAQLEQALGFSLQNDLLPLFAGEGAIAVYPGPAGSRTPTVDLVLKVADEAKARRVLRRVGALAQLGHVGTVRPVSAGGVSGFELRPNGSRIAVDYAVSKGMLIVTDSRTALGAIGGSGKKLADDPLFKDARSGAKAPDKTTGFVYVNLHAAVPAILGFIPPSTQTASLAEIRANTAPLQTLFFYGTKDGDVTRSGGFVEIR